MSAGYYEIFVKNGIPLAESETMNDCLSEFILRRGKRSTSVFGVIRFLLNIHDEDTRIRSGKNIFGPRWEDVTQQDLEDYMKYESLEKVPAHSITKADVEDLKYIRDALNGLIEALDGEHADERLFEESLAKFYMGFAKIKQD